MTEGGPVAERVIGVICRVQRLAPDTVTPESTFNSLGIDSLDAVNLVFALEDEFQVSIPLDAPTFQTVGEAIAGLRQRLEGNSPTASS